MSRRRMRFLLVVSAIWVLLMGAGAYFLYPVVGPIAASIEPNPFWSVDATGDPSAPFRVQLKTASWLAWCLAPVAVLWLLGWASGRQRSGHAG